MFGIDFVLTSTWQIDTSPQNAAPIVTPAHTVDAIFASHYIDASATALGSVKVVGQLNPGQSTVYTGDPLDLSILALDPITSNSGTNGAVTGFLPNRFLIPITAGTTPVFSRSVSEENNLMVLTEGFNVPSSSGTVNNSVLNATLPSSGASSAQINICFKLASVYDDLNLYLKHWVGSSAKHCQLSVWFNPDSYLPTTLGTPTAPADLVFTVNTAEGGGGDNNLLVISMRNHEYDSINYHDYLLPGLNMIVIIVTPISNTTGGDYYLRTVAVGA